MPLTSIHRQIIRSLTFSMKENPKLLEVAITKLRQMVKKPSAVEKAKKSRKKQKFTNLYNYKSTPMTTREPVVLKTLDKNAPTTLKSKKLSLTRKTVDSIRTTYRLTVNGRKFLCPKQKNKGKPGLFLETLLGIPASGACLDCIDGELKSFPQTKATSRSRLAKQAGLGEGDYIPSETVAITMINPAELPTTPFEKSRLYKKISHILFTPFVRDGDHIEWRNDFTFTREHPLFQQIKKDYETIQSYYLNHKMTKSEIGKYLQIRTKGQGGTAPKTFAFYFRRQFLIQLFL